MYTIVGYKNFLTKENLRDMAEIFTSIYEEDCSKAEQLIVSVLEKLMLRNPEDKDVLRGDFSCIMLLTENFDSEYMLWLEKTNRSFNKFISQTSKTYLLSCCFDKMQMEIIMEHVFFYLERDFHSPQQSILQEISEYKKKSLG